MQEAHEGKTSVVHSAKLQLLFDGAKGEGIIIEGLKNKDPKVFQMLYSHYRPKIHRLAMSIIKDEESVENIVQETFLKIFNMIHKFKGESSLSTWIYKIALNGSLTQLKRQQRRAMFETSVPDDRLTEECHASFTSPEKNSIDHDHIVFILSVLDRLEAKKKFTFIFYYVENLSINEIAEILGENRDTVSKRLLRLRAEIEEILAAEKQVPLDKKDRQTREEPSS
jgi:RNA polymerase sigma-70 factor, ECF subfamily